MNDEAVKKGLRIREIREELGYKNKQGEFAEKLGIDQTTLSAYELGKRNPQTDTIDKIIDMYHEALGVPISKLWLVNGTGDKIARKKTETSSLIDNLIALLQKAVESNHSLSISTQELAASNHILAMNNKLVVEDNSKAFSLLIEKISGKQ